VVSSSANANGHTHPAIPIPFYRLWIGDIYVERIVVSCDEDCERAEELFPEAQMILVSPGPELKLESFKDHSVSDKK
jgi:hypothetical protein